ncbi:MAG TPA: hypothetical protein VMM18_13495 [Gemmatimonadaceae bacterium]|nr:hypothetical protein [Gemmatimonadaceae bacterium]
MKRTALLAVFAGAVAASVACDRARSETYEGPYGARVADAIPRIERAVGLPFRTPPRLEARSREQVRQFLENRFNEDLPTRELAGAERAYKRFGLLPDTMQLRAFLLDLLTEQVVGYYDPRTKVLYVVEDAPDDLVGLTITHELVHALQDQYINLDSIQNLEGDNDRQSALQAVIEGQATYEQLAVMLGNRNFAEAIPGGWDRIRDLIRENSSAMPLFSAAPMLIQETLIFPYVNGAEFVRRFRQRHSESVLFDDLPISTEQILHAEKFDPATRDHPIRLTLPPSAEGTLVYENNLGEFETRLFLFQHLRDVGVAGRGAMGWGGDRYRIVEGRQGESIVWVSVWDTPLDAAGFHDLMIRVIQRRFGAGEGTPGADGTRVFRGRGRTLVLRAVEIGERPAVVYVDVPDGVNPDLIDVAEITAEEMRPETPAGQ